MITKPKIIALYLPQFHQIQENDEFWGEGFTDWITVKNAKPIFEEHIQPRVPLNNNYYDLSQEKSVMWQAELAHEYGIYGFGVYHYWFNNDKNLLTKPAEIMRDSKSLPTNYFLAWDNISWKRSWSNVVGNDWAPMMDKQQGSTDNTNGVRLLVPYILGSESDWRNHYDYVRTHFMSPNYIKDNNKPIFAILNYSPTMKEMCECWDKWAKEDGFDGMCFFFKSNIYSNRLKDSYKYDYEPHTVGWDKATIVHRAYNRVLRMMNIDPRKDVRIYDYDELWNKILAFAKKHDEPYFLHGSFVCYDDSPRRGKSKSIIVKGGTPDKFKKYMKLLIDISIKQNKEYILLTAWNEWGEGAYLEPDTINEYKYLKALKQAIGDGCF